MIWGRMAPGLLYKLTSPALVLKVPPPPIVEIGSAIPSSPQFSPVPHLFLRESLNPLHPNISIHILHTALCTFTKVLSRRICLTIKSLFSW